MQGFYLKEPLFSKTKKQKKKQYFCKRVTVKRQLFNADRFFM